MGFMEFCSNCGEKNQFGEIDGNIRFHCTICKTIHYENPKPTATLICPRGDEILLVKRAAEPGKGLWGLPGGFMELGETPEISARRELKEETALDGKLIKLLGTCSHYKSIFGDILLLGFEMKIDDWSNMTPGDDAADAELFPLNKLPPLAFHCHSKIVEMYKDSLKHA